jgi:hypothetical protein
MNRYRIWLKHFNGSDFERETKTTFTNNSIFYAFDANLDWDLAQGCGSGLIQYGSGSSIFGQSGSGSKLKQKFQRQLLSQILLKSNKKYLCYSSKIFFKK